MLRFSFNLSREADAIENAVTAVLEEGNRTFDILGGSKTTPLSTSQMTQKILERL